MRRKENLFTLREMYNFYLDHYEANGVTFQMYGKILREFNLYIRDNSYCNNVFYMPHNTGKLYIQQTLPTYTFDDNGKLLETTAGVDWVETRKLWLKYPHFQALKKFVYYENNHTNGRKMKVKWNKGMLKNISLMYFKPCRTYQRGLAKYIKKNPNTEYYGK